MVRPHCSGIKMVVSKAPSKAKFELLVGNFMPGLIVQRPDALKQSHFESGKLV